MSGVEKYVLKNDAVPTIFPNIPQKRAPKRHSSERRELEAAKKVGVEESLASHSRAVLDDVVDRSKDVQCSVDSCDAVVQTYVDCRDIGVQCVDSSLFRSKGVQCSITTTEKGTQTESACPSDILNSTINDNLSTSIQLPTDVSDDFSNIGGDDISYNPAEDEKSDTSMMQDPPYMAFIVFWSSLLALLKRCTLCGDIASVVSYTYDGSMIVVHLLCQRGHKTTCKSQPTDSQRVPEGNLRIASGILFSGNTYHRVAEIFSFSNIRFFGKTMFYKYQRKYLFPVVNERWIQWTKTKFASLKSLGTSKITGDGRCDSPGHSAKYSIYSFQDQETDEIIDFQVMQVTEAGNSNRMEKASFEKLLAKVESKGVKVGQITTDRHPQVRKYMREKRKDITYQYDVWHVAKSIFKKLLKKSKKAACKALEPWIPSIRNHFWWSCATCEGDVVMLREKWTSIVHHIKNKHKWDSGTKYTKCCHKRLKKSERKSKPWLIEGSEAFKAVQDVVFEKKLLTDLEHLTKYSHTGNLEVYHALLNKYAPKREHFSYRGMICRTQLAAMDHNEGANLPQAQLKDGTLRYKLVFPKQSAAWTVKPIKVQKNKTHVNDMVSRVIECSNKNIKIDEPSIASIPRNIASTPRPNKKDVVAEHRSRFS